MSDVTAALEQENASQKIDSGAPDTLQEKELADANQDALQKAALGSTKGEAAPNPGSYRDKLNLSGGGVEPQAAPTNEVSTAAKDNKSKSPKLSMVQSESMSLSADIDIPAVPGLSVFAKGGMKTEKETTATGDVTTKYVLDASIGVKYSFFIFSLSLSIDGSVEGKVKGDKNIGEVANAVLEEFTRWKVSDKLGEVKAEATQVLNDGFSKADARVNAAFDELSDVSDDDFRKAASGSYFWTKSPYEKVIAASKDLQASIEKAFGKFGAETSGEEHEAFFQASKIGGFMSRLGEAEDITKARAAIADAKKQYKEHMKAGREQTFEGLDGINTKNNKDVSFKATVVATFGVKTKVGKKASFDVKVSAGVQISDGDGDEFDKTVKPIVMGQIAAEYGDLKGKLSGTAVFADDPSFELKLDLATPKLALPFDDDALIEFAGEVKDIFDELRGEAEEEEATLKDPTEEDRLKKRLIVFAKNGKIIKERFDKVKGRAELLQKAREAFTPSKRSVQLGGKLAWKGTKLKGEVYAGLGGSDDMDIDLGPIKGKKSTSNKAVMKF